MPKSAKRNATRRALRSPGFFLIYLPMWGRADARPVIHWKILAKLKKMDSTLLNFAHSWLHLATRTKKV